MGHLRLLHLIHTPRHSGAEMLVYELCRLHRTWGHECAVASFAPSQVEFLTQAAELEELGVKLYFPQRALIRLGRTRHFRKAVRHFRPDAVFAHSALPSFYGRLATSRYFGSRQRFVSVLHAEDDYAGRPLAWAERLTRFRVDHVVAVSEHAAVNYVRRFGERVPVSVITNGIDIARFASADREAARRRLGVASGVRLALQVGRVCDVKQQQFSLEVLQPMLAAGRAELWFAGLTEDAAYEARLRRQAQDWGLLQAVRFLGSRADVPDLLAAADLYLMPSRYESQGIALLEALACGVSIIASDIDAFSFAREMPGVQLCALRDEQMWRTAAEAMIAAPRVTRDIAKYSIEYTANSYLVLVHGRCK
jgi:glycosyltransferase involved in cell wall biosynthesis